MSNEPQKFHFPELADKPFKVISKVGSGTFSEVYHAVMTTDCRHVALKRLRRTTSPERILNEGKILYLVGGKCHIVNILDGLRYKDQVTFVLNYFPHVDFNNYYKVIGTKGIRAYFRQLFTALDFLHSKGIVHCDIKPANCLFNPSELEFQLVDFGLAEYILKEESITMNHKFGTRGFRAPELLINTNNTPTPGIDIWSAGIILLCILSGKYPFFVSAKDDSNLEEIVAIFGSEDLKKFAPNVSVIPDCKGVPDLKEYLLKINESFNQYPDELYDLLRKLLAVNPNERFSARQALEHPFFHQ